MERGITPFLLHSIVGFIILEYNHKVELLGAPLTQRLGIFFPCCNGFLPVS